MRRALLALAVLLGALVAPVAPGVPSSSAQAAPSDIVAIVVEGTGFGHGRGMSQWGAYGWAVDHGWTWQQILDHYYGGTTLGTVANSTMTVRLQKFDNIGTIDFVSHGAGIKWNNSTVTYNSVRVVRNGSTFDVYGTDTRTCAVPQTTKLGSAPNIALTTTNNTATAPGATLGVCLGDGSVVHYRGAIDVSAPDGIRVVNRLPVEDYLRGVVPREVPASWAGANPAGPDGPGRHALQAQAVAARSYSLVQSRYAYAKTCDTTACQAYGGAATRASATAAATIREDARSDRAIAATAGMVRLRNGQVVSTEFSASNGPRTAGKTFPVVDDTLGDRTARNPNHRWTRVLDADAVAARYGLGRLTSAAMVDGEPGYDGIWFNNVRLGGTSRNTDVGAWDFRGAFNLPSPGFTVRVITRDTTSKTFGFIGDSVGNGIAGSPVSEFSVLTDGMFPSARMDMQDSRCTVNTACPGTSGVEAVAGLPANLDLVVVELGYNDWTPDMATAIDTMMNALTARGVRQVAWVNLASATGISPNAGTYGARNAALVAATARWSNLTILDWNAVSNTAEKSRWFASDGVHLTATGDAKFAIWLREQVAAMAPVNPFRAKVTPGRALRFQVAGLKGVPANATSVALNVTAVDPAGWGFLTVWPCGSAMPDASNVNFVSAGATEPNSVLAKLDATGDVCVYTSSTTHVLVDVAGWFSSGFESMVPSRFVDTRNAIGAPRAKVQPATPLRVKVAGQRGVPANATAVAMNVTAVNPEGWGFLTVWPCGSPMPDASNVNYLSAGAVEPNSVLAKLDATGEICIYTYAASDVLVDVAGWFSSGFQSLVPKRIVDTRSGIGAPLAKLAPGAPMRVTVGPAAGVPGNATSVALNVTAVDPTGWGFLTVWPCGSPKPDTSNVNFVSAGATEPNSVLAKLDGTRQVCIDTYASTHVLVDVAGWFSSGFEPLVPNRIVDTRNGIGTPG